MEFGVTHRRSTLTDDEGERMDARFVVCMFDDALGVGVGMDGVRLSVLGEKEL